MLSSLRWRAGAEGAAGAAGAAGAVFTGGISICIDGSACIREALFSMLRTVSSTETAGFASAACGRMPFATVSIFLS